ncbi:hypothetical protein [Alkalibacillus haloalkaliphilus]|uniref:hypothetical protein n=1 Tax=Alkalibacillus haloalkaliphilus TaxID=94136 RepID=UPI00036A01F6|nr:hypothetical protein [Alkalibacillus haloalkaliphilus]
MKKLLGRPTSLLIIITVLVFAMFLQVGSMSTLPGQQVDSVNRALPFMVLLIGLFFYLVYLWYEFLRPYVLGHWLIISAIFVSVHWGIAISYQQKSIEKYRQQIIDLFESQFGYIDWDYIDSVSTLFLSSHMNHQLYNVNTFLMYMSLSFFTAIVLVYKLGE